MVDQTFYGQETNLLDLSQNGPELLTDVSARLISEIHHQMTTDKSVMWETWLSIVDEVYSKTQILLETWKIQNQHRGESYVSLEVEHLLLSVGCARNKRRYPTVPRNQELFRWMLICEWIESLLLAFETC